MLSNFYCLSRTKSGRPLEIGRSLLLADRTGRVTILEWPETGIYRILAPRPRCGALDPLPPVGSLEICQSTTWKNVSDAACID